MNKVKFVLFSAGISLALVFTFGCSSSDDSGGNPGENGSLSSDSNSGHNHSSNSVAGISSSDGNSNLSSSSNGGNKSSSSSSTGISSSGGGSSSGKSSSSSGNSSSSFVNDGKECDAIFNPDNKFCYDGNVYDKCGGNTYNPVTQGCLSNKVGEKCGNNLYLQATQGCCENSGSVYILATQGCCGSSAYSQAAQFCYDNLVYNKCDGIEYPPTTHICQNKVAIPTKCNGESYNPLTQHCENGTVKNYDLFTDARDGRKYKITLIGTQTWMAENLNYDASGSVCYGKDPYNCTIYGRLYNWTLATTVCPTGWHLPSNEDWNVLITAAGGETGTKLKATSGWNSYNGIPTGTNEFGFSALPGGGGSSGGHFNNVGSEGYWWSATKSSSEHALYIFMTWKYVGWNDEYIGWSDSDKDVLFSVRCVKD